MTEELSTDNELLVTTELELVLIESGMQGPPGPGFGGGSLNMGNQPIYNVSAVGFHAEYDCGNSGAAITIDLSVAQKQKLTLTAAAPVVTIDATEAPVGHYQIRIIQDSAGGRAPSFPSLSVSRWLGSAFMPPVNGAANGESILSLYWDGANFTQALAKVGAS